MVREVPLPNGPWISLDSLLNDVLHDFIALQNAGLLVLDRQWDRRDTGDQCADSSPALHPDCRQDCRKKHFCDKTYSQRKALRRPLRSFIYLEAMAGNRPGAAAKGIINETLPYLQEMVDSIGGEMSVSPQTRRRSRCAFPPGLRNRRADRARPIRVFARGSIIRFAHHSPITATTTRFCRCPSNSA